VPTHEFREYYATLSEEGLREIDRADLTDAARACYDDELASRGLTIESAPPVIAPGSGLKVTDDIEWVPLDTFDVEEIKLVREMLDAEQIPTDTDPSPAANYPPLAAGSVLFVPKPLLARAREVLAAQISDEELIAEAEAGKPPEDA
jgi:hypothetical protein